MEATALSVGKSVLNGVIRYATSALAEEVALQLGVQHDQVVKVWVKQVRDVAYDVEDTLQEFSVCLQKQSWWHIRRTLLDRRRVAKQMKELRANVEDAATVSEQSGINSATLIGINEAKHMSKQEKSKVDLDQLVNEKENDLRECRAKALLGAEKTTQELAEKFDEFMNGRRYFIVINDLNTLRLSTAQVEVASLCAGRESIVSELSQMFGDQIIYAFHQKVSQDGTYLTKMESSSNRALAVQITSLWRPRIPSDLGVGNGGLGKTTLVKNIYQNQELSSMFEKRACVTVMRPFNLEGLLRSLIMQLDRESSGKKDAVGLMGSTKNTLQLMPLLALINEMGRLIGKKRCLIVLDDVFEETVDLDTQYPELVEQTELILKKCGRLPLAIVTIGGFLANHPKKPLEWKKLNDHISAELGMNPKLGTIRNVLMRSYDGLPYHLKSCFLYMPIFPEDHKVGRGRLARRWSAEGYSMEVHGRSAEEVADSYFMELISRSMILPSQQSIHSTKGIDSCQVHDLIREIGISKSMEENLVFTLEEGCSSNRQVTVRHLAISANWKGDKSEFESKVDMSRLRSITCFGEWKTFFISQKMKLVRVLDLEDTTGLYDRHLKHVGKLLHLRYLSVRGCNDIVHLPDSLCSLRQLETLDVRDTQIMMLPKKIIKLQKLNNLRAGKKMVDEEVSVDEELVHTFPHAMQNQTCVLTLVFALFCLGCCAPQFLTDSDMSRRDLCTAVWCHVLPAIAMRLDLYGVLLPRGTGKLKALRTLGVVNIARRQGKDVLKDIKGLIWLRKLGVTGVNKENGQELCSAIVGLSRLQSVLIRSEGEPGLCGSLDGKFSFPENLQSLKLYGNLVKLPEWIKGLKNLVKLKLRSTMLSELSDAIQVLGDLPNLGSLHLLRDSIRKGQVFCFHQGAFPILVLLELGSFVSVNFEQGAIPMLELLKFVRMDVNRETILGLPSVSSLKEVVLEGNYTDRELAYLRAELAKNPNGPIVKTV
uniref:NBS-LRR disease resistance protein n=1 Tax=Dasypyrum villosum TaxID=40247 RepID=A0A8K1IAR9_9POAL|nr:NBS-LRR disease resistance protein [Dasypyrum villosum]